MKLLVVTDSYIPYKNSCAKMMHELSKMFVNLGHSVSVVTIDDQIEASIKYETLDNINVFRVKNKDLRTRSLYKRFIREFFISWNLYHKLNKTDFFSGKYDLIIWYSPTIFFGILIWLMKYKFKCKTYLVLRDIFPLWLVETETINKGFRYYLLKLFEFIQYSAADKIGIEADGNKKFISHKFQKKTETLWNWIEPDICKNESNIINKEQVIQRILGQSIRLNDKSKICIYSGNFGFAQDPMNLARLVEESYSVNPDIKFLFVGSGTEKNKLKNYLSNMNGVSCLFSDPISQEKLNSVIQICNVGIFTLNLNSKINNIPGKFLSYVSNNIPTFGIVNKSNDIVKIINDFDLGITSSDNSASQLTKDLHKLLDRSEDATWMKEFTHNSTRVMNEIFSIKNATSQILDLN